MLWELLNRALGSERIVTKKETGCGHQTSNLQKVKTLHLVSPTPRGF